MEENALQPEVQQSKELANIKKYKKNQGNKILRHPKCDDIIRMLTEGKSPEKIAGWLKECYPSNKRMQINQMTIFYFRKNHLNLAGEALKELKGITKDNKENAEAQQMKETIQSHGAVIRKKNEFLAQVVDTNKEFIKINDFCWERLARYQRLELEEKLNSKHDSVMVQYIKELRGLLELYLKATQILKESAGTNVNINISEVQEEVMAIKNAVQRALIKTDSRLVQPFVEEFTKEMQELGHMEPEKFFEDYAKMKNKVTSIKTKGDNIDVNIKMEREKVMIEGNARVLDEDISDAVIVGESK